MLTSENLDSKELVSQTFHEIAQPLTSLRACLDLALRKPLDLDGYRRALEDAIEQHERLVNSLNRVRHLADAFTPGVPRPCDVSEVLSDVVETFAPVAEEKNIRVENLIGSTRAIQTDREKVQQLLLLLMDEVLQTCGGTCVKITLCGIENRAVIKIRSQRTDGTRSELAGRNGMMRRALAESIQSEVRESSTPDATLTEISIPDLLG